MKTRFGFIPIHSLLVKDEDTVNKIVGSYIKALEQIGGKRWTKEDLKNPKPLFYLMVTGGTEELLLKWHTERNKYIKNEPVFLLAHPTHNSLPASLEVLARIQQDDMKGQIFYSNGQKNKNVINQI